MKVIGLKNNNTIQYVLVKLSGYLTISFPQDLKSTEVLICQDTSDYRKYMFQLNKNKLEYKVVIFLDYWRQLENISGIQILPSLPESFITYVKNTCTFKVPHIRFLEDSIISDKIAEIETGSFFTKIKYPLICNGIKNVEKKKEIIKNISVSILECLKKNPPPILRYKSEIKAKYLKSFLNWLKTAEAKKVSECLLLHEIKYNFDSFEINYLINSLEEE